MVQIKKYLLNNKLQQSNHTTQITNMKNTNNTHREIDIYLITTYTIVLNNSFVETSC